MDSLNSISFVKRGKNRKKVFLALDKAMMPSELVIKIYGKNSNTHFNIVSRALAELTEKGIVEVLNPERKNRQNLSKDKIGRKNI